MFNTLPFAVFAVDWYKSPSEIFPVAATDTAAFGKKEGVIWKRMKTKNQFLKIWDGQNSPRVTFLRVAFDKLDYRKLLTDEKYKKYIIFRVVCEPDVSANRFLPHRNFVCEKAGRLSFRRWIVRSVRLPALIVSGKYLTEVGGRCVWNWFPSVR